jgi:hypothetical protein
LLAPASERASTDRQARPKSRGMSITLVPAAPHAPPVAHPASSACAVCGADVSKSPKLPATERFGVKVVCPTCAAIAVMDGAKLWMLRTHEWVSIVLEPFGFELQELRLVTAKRPGHASPVR